MGHQSRLKQERKRTVAMARSALKRMPDEKLVRLGETLLAHWESSDYVDRLVIGELTSRGYGVEKRRNVGVSTDPPSVRFVKLKAAE
jgi:hypothetical protein